MNKLRFILIIIVAILLSQAAYGEWTPPYEEDELGIMNKSLEKILTKDPKEKWKKITGVKDIFKGKAYSAPLDYKPEASEVDRAPEYFDNKTKAKLAGAKCEHIKSTEEQTCLLLVREGQGAGLIVYDRDNKGRYKKNQIICVPTFYSTAAVDFVDLGRKRPKLIRIEHVFGHGTDLYSLMHWVFGWHNNEFRTVLWEKVYERITVLGDDNYFYLNYKISQGRRPNILLTYSFDKTAITAEPYDFHAKWREWLFWDDNNFSFYNPSHEKSKLYYSKGLFCKRVKIGAIRKRILTLGPVPNPQTCNDNIADDYFEKIWENEACERSENETE